MSGAADYAARLAEQRAALAAATGSPQEHQAVPVTAESGKGRVRVTLGTDGRVSQIEVDPKGFKEGSDFIAEHVRLALNEALDRRAEMVGTGERVPDLNAINESIAEIQAAAVPKFQEMSASITQVMAKLNSKSS
jgi:DNA-binding protein YbaB